MINLASRETLALRWAEVINDPTLRDIPYKIELNNFGKIEMTPATTRWARLRGRIAFELGSQLTGGDVMLGCSTATENGISVSDVAWASNEFLEAHGETTPFPRAPEICVEVCLPWDSKEEVELRACAYLAACAREVWIVSEDGELSVFDASGSRAASSYPATLNLPPRAKR